MSGRASSLLFLVCFASCAGKAPPIPIPAPPAQGELTLFLIGDGGKAESGRRSGPPRSRAVRSRGSTAARSRYSSATTSTRRGLPSEGAADRKEMERRLLDQMQAVKGAERAVFVPGNHDWNNRETGGLEAILRQEELIREARRAEGVSLSFPRAAARDRRCSSSGASSRSSPLDTHWWLHEHEKPGPETCDPGTEESVVRKLRESLSSKKGRHAVVVAHHPLLSSGLSRRLFRLAGPPVPSDARLRAPLASAPRNRVPLSACLAISARPRRISRARRTGACARRSRKRFARILRWCSRPATSTRSRF